MNKDCRKYQEDLLALLEGGLGASAESALMRHLDECAACRIESEPLMTLRADLEFIGEAVVRNAPEVNLVGAVMTAVSNRERATKERPKVIALEQARTKRPRVYRWLAAGAAVAAVLLLFWASGYRITKVNYTEQMRMASSKADHEAGTEPPAPNGSIPRTPSPQLTKPPLLEIPKPLFMPSGEPRNVGKTEGLSVNDVLNARREALSDPNAMNKISQWASLTLDKARKIVQDPNAPFDAKVDASKLLPSNEAQAVLLAAVATQPDDANLRLELANAYEDDPQTASKAAPELASAASIDPENALSQYKLAALLLAQGDKDGAEAALEQAQALAKVDPYTSESATAHEQALMAAGMNPNTAGALAALTAGTDQYTDLVTLGRQLLDYGKQYAQAGDTQFAQQLYQSVQQLGVQTTASASYSSEQLAGLDLQQAAVDTLSNLTQFMKSPQNVQMLSQTAHGIATALGGVVSFMGNMDSFFGQITDPSAMQGAANFILHNGDLNLLNSLGNRQ